MRRHGEKPGNIQLTLMKLDESGLCTVNMISHIAGRPAVSVTMESVRMGMGFPVFCKVDHVEEKRQGDALVLRLHGRLERKKGDVSFPSQGQELPFLLELTLVSEAYRVNVKGDFLELPRGVKIDAFGPCFVGTRFADENNPPFDMATQSFTFFETSGFGWISDADRVRSEYHCGRDDGGAWSQHFKVIGTDVSSAMISAASAYTNEYSSGEKVAPLLGWVAKDNSHMIGLSGENVYDIAVRWGPCLHSDMLTDEKTGASFKTVIYFLPVDLEFLLKMVKQDFGVDDNSLYRAADALWPYQAGVLIDNLEDENLALWDVSKGTLTPYAGSGVWINGNLQEVPYPDGITEGKGSGLWEIPAGTGHATAIRRCSLRPDTGSAVTHISVDVINRSSDTVIIDGIVEDSNAGISRTFRLNYWANRRLLIPLPHPVTSATECNFILKTAQRSDPVTVVLDNVRIYHDHTPSENRAKAGVDAGKQTAD